MIFRNRKILNYYRSGKTFQEIGKMFNFSRSRAQQIVIQTIKNEIIEEFNIKNINNDIENKLSAAAKDEIQTIFLNRRSHGKDLIKNEVIKRIQEKMKSIPHYSNFLSLNSYAKAIGEDIYIIQKYFPKISDDIITSKKQKWSRLYNKCRNCSTTSTKHRSLGLCEKCYVKSDEFKEMLESSRIKNGDRWKIKQKEYAKKYAKRPEVREKNRRENNEKNFNGNREIAIKRDGFKCKKCNITREDSIKKIGKDLFVMRVKKNNNNLDNLITLCQKCFNTKNIKVMHKNNPKHNI